MAKNRDPRRGFVARWFRRLRWLNRMVFIGGLVAGAVKAVRRRSGGGRGGGTGPTAGGPGGSGRPAPVGSGPAAPRLAASVVAPSSDAGVSASSAPSAVRTLVSVPPLPDDGTDADAPETTEAADVVPTSPTGAVELDDSNNEDVQTATTAPVLTIVADAGSDAPDAPGAGDSWVAPIDGGDCPPGYPIKANNNSGIYHVPGGRSYNRTVAERCYTDAEAAEADGYRRAKA